MLTERQLLGHFLFKKERTAQSGDNARLAGRHRIDLGYFFFTEGCGLQRPTGTPTARDLFELVVDR
jgi:hypothetical protein